MALGLLIGGFIIENISAVYAFSIQSVLFALLCFTMVNKFLLNNKKKILN